MDGLHDGQAIKTIIADLQPRKLVVIKSTEESTRALLDFFASTTSITTDVFYPSSTDVVRIGEHVQSFSLQLGDSISGLLSGKWSKFEGYEVAMVDGKIAFATGSTVPTLEAPYVELQPLQPEVKVEEEPPAADPATETMEEAAADAVAEKALEEAEGMAAEAVEEVKAEAEPEAAADEPMLVDTEVEVAVKTEPHEDIVVDAEAAVELVKESPPPAMSAAPVALPSSLFIGDLRLLTLKTRLAALSIPAEFAGEGVLVCGPGVLGRSDGDEKKTAGSIVAVRKLAEGEVVIEGAISATYFAVRKELYGSYAHVTTG